MLRQICPLKVGSPAFDNRKFNEFDIEYDIDVWHKNGDINGIEEIGTKMTCLELFPIHITNFHIYSP